MDRETKARVDSLVFALKHWNPDRLVPVEDLARRYRLDPLMVRRLAQAERLMVPMLEDEFDAEKSDPRRSTGLLDIKGILGKTRDE